MSSPSSSELLAAARTAVASWGVDVSSIEILSRSENVVFDVESVDGTHVALRLHRPGYNPIEEMRSEVAWVRALAAAGLVVPQALPAENGDFYIATQVGDEVRQAGVISWIDGKPLGGPLDDGRPPVEHFGRIGEIAAEIRRHHHAWTPPPGFTRRRWDAEGLAGLEPLWGSFWDLDTLSSVQRSLFSQVRERLFDELSSISVNADRFGLIHADLHLGNLMADDGTLTVIDFDDSGFGWFAHEIGVALYSAYGEPGYDEARQAFIDGYRAMHPLTDDEIATIDTFLTVRAMMVVGWLHRRPELPVFSYFDDIASDAEEEAEQYLSR